MHDPDVPPPPVKPVRAPGTPEDEFTVLERSNPDPSSANDVFVAGMAIAGAVFAVGFALSLRLGGAIGLYSGLLALSCFCLALAVRRYFYDRFPEIVASQLRNVPTPEALAASTPVTDSDGDDGPVSVSPRRTFLTRTLLAASATFGASLLALVPSLGPGVGSTLRQTPWARGVRLVTNDGQTLRPEDVEIGSIASVWPSGNIGFERASVVVIRLATPPEDPTNFEWVVDDTLVAYSKICTHAGCPVALYREQDESLFCPCHQSTFDVPHACQPVFGPAARALPQLPLGTDDTGVLIALGDFEELAGPSFG